MAFNALASSYIFASNKIKITANFFSPTSLGTISIDVSGNYTYYVAYRYTNTTTLDKISSPYSSTPFVDTSLSDNTLYTYKIYPSDDNGNIIGVAAMPIGGSSAGTICSLANYADLSLNYNGGNCTTTSVGFDYAGLGGNGYSTLSVCSAYGNGVTRALMTRNAYSLFANGLAYSTTANTFSTSFYVSTFTGPATVTTLVLSTDINTQFIFNVYVVNKDGIGNGVPACMKSVRTCTLGTIISAGTFVIPTQQYMIFDSNANSKKGATITGITGTFTSLRVNRTGGTQGSITITGSTPGVNGTFCISDLSTNLPCNTTYAYSIYPENSLGYAKTGVSTTLNQTTGNSVGTICTLADPSGLTMTPVYPPDNLYDSWKATTNPPTYFTTHYRVSFNYVGVNNSASTRSYSKVILNGNNISTSGGRPTYDFSTSSPATPYVVEGVNGWANGATNRTIFPNTKYTLTAYVINADGLGNGIPSCLQTATCYTPAYLFKGTTDYGISQSNASVQLSGLGYGLTYPTVQNALYNNLPEYTTTTCPSGSTLVNLEGYFSSIAIQRTSPAGETVLIPQSGTYNPGTYNTGVSLADLSQNLPQNTKYNIKIVLTNALGMKTIVGNLLTAGKIPVNGGSSMSTLATVSFTVAPNSSNLRYNQVSFDFSYNPPSGDTTAHCVIYDQCNNKLETYGSIYYTTNWKISYNYTSNVTGVIANVASTPNTPYRYTLYSLNQHAVGEKIPAAGYSFTSWTGGKIISANLVTPSVKGRIYNSRSNSTYGNIIGNFAAVRIARCTVAPIDNTATRSTVQYISSGESAIDDNLTFLPSNTIFYLSIIPVNGEGTYCDLSNNFNSVGTPKGTDSRYTLVDPSTAILTVQPYIDTYALSLTPNRLFFKTLYNKSYAYYGGGTGSGYPAMFNINSDGTLNQIYPAPRGTAAGSLLDAVGVTGGVYVYLKGIYTRNAGNVITGSQPLEYNKRYNIIVCYINTENIYDASVGFIFSIATYPIISYAGNFVVSDTLGSIYDSVKQASVTDISGIYSYFTFTRTSWPNQTWSAPGTSVSWTSPQRLYGNTLVDASTNLGDNTFYSYSITPYNSDDVAGTPTNAIYNRFTRCLSGNVFTPANPNVWKINGQSPGTIPNYGYRVSVYPYNEFAYSFKGVTGNAQIGIDITCSDFNRGGRAVLYFDTPVGSSTRGRVAIRTIYPTSTVLYRPANYPSVVSGYLLQYPYFTSIENTVNGTKYLSTLAVNTSYKLNLCVFNSDIAAVSYDGQVYSYPSTSPYANRYFGGSDNIFLYDFSINPINVVSSFTASTAPSAPTVTINKIYPLPTEIPTLTITSSFSYLTIKRTLYPGAPTGTKILGNGTYTNITSATFTDPSFSDGVTQMPGGATVSYNVIAYNSTGQTSVSFSFYESNFGFNPIEGGAICYTFVSPPTLTVKTFSLVAGSYSGNVYVKTTTFRPDFFQAAGNNICYSLSPNTAKTNMYWNGIRNPYDAGPVFNGQKYFTSNAIATYMYYSYYPNSYTSPFTVLETIGIQLNGLAAATKYTLSCYINTPPGNSITSSVTFTTP